MQLGGKGPLFGQCCQVSGDTNLPLVQLEEFDLLLILRAAEDQSEGGLLPVAQDGALQVLLTVWIGQTGKIEQLWITKYRI